MVLPTCTSELVTQVYDEEPIMYIEELAIDAVLLTDLLY
jgi:hypothetical protein